MIRNQNIDYAISGRYTVCAPYKAGAGRGNPKFTEEHNRAHAVFSCHEHCYAQIMVGRAGPTSVGPGSSVTGISTPVRLTTYMVVESLGGEYFKLTEEAAIMATVPTKTHPKIDVVNGKAVTTSLFEYFKLLRLAGVPGYISCVAVNPATGFSSLNLSTAHNRASGFFVCNAQSRLNYGGLSGGAERLAGDCGYRSANPAQVTTSCLAATRGGLKTLSTGAVAMTTTTTHPFLKIETVNGKAVIFSLHVACHFKRMHQNIIDKIEYLNCSREFFARNFMSGTYHLYGDSLRGYYITRDGLMMLQLGLSLRTMRYYESCIEAFHEAETSLNHCAFRRNQWEVRP
ncbi:ash family protein [Citrobacter portucalensis]|uniref:ash family protein n=1 Tax=Citrobacter portucalensis TaxID=1639133 RepID=UPI0015803F2E|nr:ash family protein [Citrobacter portucalensis]NUH56523.1 ash family protein [Citrobacter portucalensis]